MENKSFSEESTFFMINQQLLELDLPPSIPVFLTSVAPVTGQNHTFDVICKRWLIIYN